MNIYEITGNILSLQTMAEEGIIDEDTLKDTMESLEGELEDKADAYAKVIKNIEAQATAIGIEEDRLRERRQVLENNIKRMKKTLQESMELTGKTKFKTTLFSFNVQNNAKSVVLDTEDLMSIPEKYQKATITINKTLIKEDLESGAELPFAHIEQTRSIRIR